MHGRGLFRRYPRTDAFKVGRVYDLGAVVFVGLRQTFGRRSLLARERFYRLEAGWPIPFFEAVGRTDSGPSVTDWRWGIERSGTFSCDGVRLQRVIPTRPRWGAIAVFMIVVMAVGEGGGRALDAARRRRRRRRGRCAACGYPAPDGAPTCPECGGAIARSFAPPSLA